MQICAFNIYLRGLYSAIRKIRELNSFSFFPLFCAGCMCVYILTGDLVKVECGITADPTVGIANKTGR